MGCRRGVFRLTQGLPGLGQSGFDGRGGELAAGQGMPQGFLILPEALHQAGGLLPAGGQLLPEGGAVAQGVQAFLLLCGVLPHLLDAVADAVMGDLALAQGGFAFLPVIQQLLIQIVGLLDDFGFDLRVELGHPLADLVVFRFGAGQPVPQTGKSAAETLFGLAAAFQLAFGGAQLGVQIGHGGLAGADQVGVAFPGLGFGAGGLADGLLQLICRVPGGALQLVALSCAFLHLIGDHPETGLLFLQTAGGGAQLAFQLADQGSGGFQRLFHHRFHAVEHGAGIALHALPGGNGAADHALGIHGGLAGPVQGLLQLSHGSLRAGQFLLGLPVLPALGV